MSKIKFSKRSFLGLAIFGAMFQGTVVTSRAALAEGIQSGDTIERDESAARAAEASVNNEVETARDGAEAASADGFPKEGTLEIPATGSRSVVFRVPPTAETDKLTLLASAESEHQQDVTMTVSLKYNDYPAETVDSFQQTIGALKTTEIKRTFSVKKDTAYSISMYVAAEGSYASAKVTYAIDVPSLQEDQGRSTLYHGDGPDGEEGPTDDCMMWGVWCYSDQRFNGSTSLGEQAAVEAAVEHTKQTGHRAAAKCAIKWLNRAPDEPQPPLEDG